MATFAKINQLSRTILMCGERRVADTFEYDVFLSHSTKDKPAVRELAERLKGDGLRVWLDEWVIKPSDSIPMAVEKGLERSRTLVLVMSKAAFDSGWVTLERHTVLFRDPTNQQRRFIPLRPDDCEIMDSLRQFAFVDWRTKDDVQYGRLLDSLTPQVFLMQFDKHPCFVGRADSLAEIENRFSSGQDKNAVVLMSGLGGIGKTQIAVEYCHRHRREYQALVWINATTQRAFRRRLVEILQNAGRSIAEPGGESELVKEVGRWLQTQRNYLLVLDDVGDLSVVLRLKRELTGGHILITTRLDPVDMIGITNPIRLTTWSERDSLEFLELRTGRKITETCKSDAALIAREVDGLPLALEQVGAFVHSTNVTFSWYLQHFRKRKLELLESKKAVLGSVGASVATAWLMNFSQVERESDLSYDLLKILAFLESDRIPFLLLAHGLSAFRWENNDHEFKRLQTTIKHDDRLAVLNLLQPLQKYSLVTIQGQTESCKVHRMVQEVIKYRLFEKSARVYSCTVSLVTEALVELNDTSTTLTLQERGFVLPHAEYLLESLEDCQPYIAVGLLIGIAQVNVDFGRKADAEEILDKAWTTCNNGEYKVDGSWMDHRPKIAELYRNIGREVDGEKVFIDMIKEFASRDGKKSVASATVRLYLARYHAQSGKLSEALFIMEQAVCDLAEPPFFSKDHKYLMEAVVGTSLTVGVMLRLGREYDAVDFVHSMSERGEVFRNIMLERIAIEFPEFYNSYLKAD